MTLPSYDTWRLDPAHRYGEDSVDGWAAYERAKTAQFWRDDAFKAAVNIVHRHFGEDGYYCAQDILALVSSEPPAHDAEVASKQAEAILRPFLTTAAIFGITPSHKWNSSGTPWEVCAALRVAHVAVADAAVRRCIEIAANWASYYDPTYETPEEMRSEPGHRIVEGTAKAIARSLSALLTSEPSNG